MPTAADLDRHNLEADAAAGRALIDYELHVRAARRERAVAFDAAFAAVARWLRSLARPVAPAPSRLARRA